MPPPEHHGLCVIHVQAWCSEIGPLTSLDTSLIELDRRNTRRRPRVTAALSQASRLTASTALHAAAAFLATLRDCSGEQKETLHVSCHAMRSRNSGEKRNRGGSAAVNLGKIAAIHFFLFFFWVILALRSPEIFEMAAVGRGYNELERRRVIKILLDSGVDSVRELCERSGLGKSTVRRVRNRLLAGGTIDRKVGSGSLQYLSGNAVDTMHEMVENVLVNGGSASAAKIRSHIEETGEVVSRWTVCRSLHREGLAPKKRRPGPALMDHHRAARQVWSLLRRDDDFDTTVHVFIDEANFQLHSNTQVVLVSCERSSAENWIRNAAQIAIVERPGRRVVCGHNAVGRQAR